MGVSNARPRWIPRLLACCWLAVTPVLAEQIARVIEAFEAPCESSGTCKCVAARDRSVWIVRDTGEIWWCDSTDPDPDNHVWRKHPFSGISSLSEAPEWPGAIDPREILVGNTGGDAVEFTDTPHPKRIPTELGPFVDVTHVAYGAIGNGTSDSTAAIKLAIEAARSNGLALYFPEGDFRITEDLYVPVDIIGAGSGKTTIRCDSPQGEIGQRCLRAWSLFDADETCSSGTCTRSGNTCSVTADCFRKGCGNLTGSSCRAEQISDPPGSRFSQVEEQEAGLSTVTLEASQPGGGSAIGDWDVGDVITVCAGKSRFDADDSLWRICVLAKVVEVDTTNRILHLDQPIHEALNDDNFTPSTGIYYAPAAYASGASLSAGNVRYNYGECSEVGTQACTRDAECTGTCQGVCWHGSNDGTRCTDSSVCTGGGTCSKKWGIYTVGLQCVGGANAGESCTIAAQCVSASCSGSCTTSGAALELDTGCEWVPQYSNLGSLLDCDGSETDLTQPCGRHDHRPVIQLVERPALGLTWKGFTFKYDGDDPGVSAMMIKNAEVTIEDVVIGSVDPDVAVFGVQCADAARCTLRNVTQQQSGIEGALHATGAARLIGGWNADMKLYDCTSGSGGPDGLIFLESGARLWIQGGQYGRHDRSNGTQRFVGMTGGAQASVTGATILGFTELFRANGSGDPITEFNGGISRHPARAADAFLGRVSEFQGNTVTVSASAFRPNLWGPSAIHAWQGNVWLIDRFPASASEQTPTRFDADVLTTVSTGFEAVPSQAFTTEQMPLTAFPLNGAVTAVVLGMEVNYQGAPAGAAVTIGGRRKRAASFKRLFSDGDAALNQVVVSDTDTRQFIFNGDGTPSRLLQEGLDELGYDWTTDAEATGGYVSVSFLVLLDLDSSRGGDDQVNVPWTGGDPGPWRLKGGGGAELDGDLNMSGTLTPGGFTCNDCVGPTHLDLNAGYVWTPGTGRHTWSTSGGSPWLFEKTAGGGTTVQIERENADTPALDFVDTFDTTQSWRVGIDADEDLIIQDLTAGGSPTRVEIHNSNGLMTLGALPSCDSIDTNGSGTFGCGTDDDVPESGDFGALALAGDVSSSGLTTTIADNSVDGTDIAIASQATGDLAYYNGTDWVRLGIGSAGQVLEVNAGGTAPEWDTDDSGGGGGSPSLTINIPGPDAADIVYIPVRNAMTLSAVKCLVKGGTSVEIDVQECDADCGSCVTTGGAPTCATTLTTDSTFSDATIAAGGCVAFDIGTVTGTVTQLPIALHY